MRYRKGGIDLSSPHDTFLLQTVLRARHSSHEQLWEFMQYKTSEDRRRIFNWRLKRLVDHELVHRRSAASRSWVYSISHEGADYLVGLGESAALVVAGGFVDLEDTAVRHSLELNEIHLALLKAKILTSWQSDLEIRSLNELTGFGSPKDYDAVVKVEHEGRVSQFALEYERTPKAPARYISVRRAIERECDLDCVLYLAPAYSMLAHVADAFSGCKAPVYFGLATDFRRDLLDTMVTDCRRIKSLPLNVILEINSRSDELRRS
jgi:hypothetical protein